MDAARFGFQTFDLWKKAHELTMAFFKATSTMPPQFASGYLERSRVDCMSLCVAITQAYSRRVLRERIDQYHDAAKLVERVRYYLILASEMEFFPNAHELLDDCEDILRIIYANITRYSKELG